MKRSPFVGKSDISNYSISYDGWIGGSVAKHSSHILELARKGAQYRLEELQAEIAALIRSFPHLRTAPTAARRGRKPQADSTRASAAPSAATATAATEGRRRRRGMSAAQRKAVSERMKKYWAARRAARKK
jgi:hypothetical protein